MKTSIFALAILLSPLAMAAPTAESIRVDLSGFATESFLVHAGTKAGPNQYSVSFFVENKNHRNRAIPEDAFLAIRKKLESAWAKAEPTATTPVCPRPFRVSWQKPGAKAPRVLNACADRFDEPSQHGLAQWYAAVSLLR